MILKSFYFLKFVAARLKVFLVFVVPLFLFINYCSAQNDTLYFGHFGTAQWISNNNVSCVIQDHLGYMWYGTQVGLNKFDGYGFTVYLHEPKNENSLVSDVITCMTPGEGGLIWIGTAGKGLNLYDTYSGKFTLYTHKTDDVTSISSDSITSLFADSSGIIWIGTQNAGLNAFNPKAGTFKTYRHHKRDPNSLSSDRITSIGSKGTGVLWIGTSTAGMNAFDTKARRFSIYRHEQGILNSISSDVIHAIHVDNSSMIWIATPNGLNKFDPANGNFTIYQHDDLNPFSIVSNNVTSVFQDKYGKIWAGTADKGVNVYYKETNEFLSYVHDNSQLNSLSSNKINSISQGRSGMMWIATRDGGLNAFNPRSLRFNLFNPFHDKYDHDHAGCITTLNQSANGMLWIGTMDDGITVYKNADKSSVTFREFGTNSINCTMIDHLGIMWIGTDEGLNTVDPETKKISKINFQSPLNGLSSNDNEMPSFFHITILAETRTHSILIGTENGLFVFDPEKKKSVLYEHRKNDPSSIGGNIITAIREDDEGMIWVGTWGGGLNKFDPSVKKFITYRHTKGQTSTIGSDYIKSVYINSFGNILAGTQDGGLNILNKKTNQFTCYSTADGLPGNTVNAILEDDYSNLWIGTDYGICRLSFDSAGVLHTRLYDIKDGLPTPQFDMGTCLKTADGHMLFSCCKGLISFNPDNISPNKYQPPVVITDFRLFYKQVVPGDDSKILTTSISVTKNLQLSYNQNVFSFEFTAISFINPEKNKYAFKMEGFDKNWNYTNYKNRVATYTNLPPGDYVFHVKASNNDGVWNEEGTSVQIRITQPFWKSKWFIGSLILLLAFLIYIAIGLRSRGLGKQKLILEKAVEDRTIELKEEKNKAEESEKFKQQFVANMSHEIRTPMNAVMGMTQLVLDGKLSLQQRKYMNAIRHSSENLLVILNDILDLSKLEAGKIELEYIPFRLSEQLQFLYETFQLKAEEKSLLFSVEPSRNIPDILIGDPTRLLQVLINLVGNAIKFTEEGSVKVICKSEDFSDEIVKIEFVVKDTGIGIPKEQLDVIFNSFAQGNSEISRKYGGTGLGLTISKQFIEKQGGVLKVKSAPGKGSEFAFSITFPKGDKEVLSSFNQAKLSINPDSLNGVRILLAEDNLYNRIVTVDTLRKLIKNVAIETALNGKEVIKWLQRKQFDVILMDLQMPEMDGYETTTFIRDQMPEPICHIPIIAVTASAIKTELKKCSDLGMNGYLAKPFVRKNLLEQIAAFYKPEGPGEMRIEKRGLNLTSIYTDLSDLAHLTEGDTDQMQKYIQLFLESVAFHTTIIKEAIDNGDFISIKKSIHALKSQVKLMGIVRLEHVIENIEENLSENGKKHDLSLLLNQFFEICTIAAEELKFELIH